MKGIYKMKNFLIFIMFLIAGIGIYYTLSTSYAENPHVKQTDIIINDTVKDTTSTSKAKDTTSTSKAKDTTSTSKAKDTTSTSKEEKYNLVDLIELNSNIYIDLRYSRTNNFTGKQIYPYSARAFLLKDTAQKLIAANEELYELGYRIKVLDAYRPHKYQYILRAAAEEQNPTTATFVANPDTGSHHNRGASVDITLTDLEGRELNMPTEYDHFGPEASIYYNGCTKEQMINREILGTVMEKHGFRRISSEWWHFDDVNHKDYPILEVDFNELY
jgi:D-alanyl-D-alanine dipeptidase